MHIKYIFIDVEKKKENIFFPSKMKKSLKNHYDAVFKERTI